MDIDCGEHAVLIRVHVKCMIHEMLEYGMCNDKDISIMGNCTLVNALILSVFKLESGLIDMSIRESTTCIYEFMKWYS